VYLKLVLLKLEEDVIAQPAYVHGNTTKHEKVNRVHLTVYSRHNIHSSLLQNMLSFPRFWTELGAVLEGLLVDFRRIRCVHAT
jgi:hypothetical protein